MTKIKQPLLKTTMKSDCMELFAHAFNGRRR